MAKNGELIDLETGDSLAFQYMPAELKIGRAPEYGDNTIVGQSHPRSQFIGGGPKLVKFTLWFHWETDDAGEVYGKVRWLESLTYPDVEAGGGMRTAPHPVAIHLGETDLGKMFVLRRFEAEFPDLDPRTLYPLVAKVDLGFSELARKPVSYKTIRLGAGQLSGLPTPFPGGSAVG
jgi:hypothetical protein